MDANVKQQPESGLKSYASPGSAAVPADNRIIWILAVSPIVGIFFELLGLALIGMPWLIYPDIIALALSIYLGYIDKQRLETMGHDTSQLGPPWLVPVYLFKRARRLKHKLTYFTVWCGLCAVVILL